MAEGDAVLNQVNVVVRDMEAMAAFYRRLGVEIDDGAPPWDMHHRTAVGGGEVDFELDSQASAAVWNEGWRQGTTGVIIGFGLASREAVDRTYAELTDAGYVGQQAPCDAFWGSRYAVVEDPDGNVVGLMSPMDPNRRTAPPNPSG